MAERGRIDGDQDRDQFAAYVAELTAELAMGARRHRLEALAYLLEIAQLEAKSASRQGPPDAAAKIAHA